MKSLFSLLVTLVLTPLALHAQDSLPASFRELRWVERDPAALTPTELAQVGAAQILAPAQWGLEVAAETLGTTPFTFLRGKIGSGTGYRYFAAFGYVPRRRSPVWSSLAVQSFTPFDSLSGPPAFTLTGCLVRGRGPLVGYVSTARPPTPDVMDILRSDSLVPSSGWYRWANGRFTIDETLPSQELRAWCHEGLAKLP